jgi:hypothetical protein
VQVHENLGALAVLPKLDEAVMARVDTAVRGVSDRPLPSA